MPESNVEFELKFLVPRRARAALRAALGGRGAKLERRRLVARYFDTADRRLARAGMSLRLRREGRRWMQTLKAGGETALARFEHEVPRTDAVLDAAAHAGTPAGDRLAGLLADGEPLLQRYGTDIRRVTRTLRTRGATVELAFDEGRITAQDRELRVCELELELLSGSRPALFTLAERWRARFGLVVDPRSKAERGDALADGRPPVAPRRARPAGLGRRLGVAAAWREVLDECIAQVLVNASGLAAPVGVEAAAGRAAVDPPEADRTELVHQLRVGLRRLRSAFRLFRDWVPPVPEPIATGARDLSRAVGAVRDRDVLAQAIEPALQRAGAPGSLQPAGGGAAADAGDAVALAAGQAAQQWLLALLAWRHGLDADEAPAAARPAEPPAPSSEPPVPDLEPPARNLEPPAPDPLAPLAPLVRRRLVRWLRSIADDAGRFAQLDEAARHALRRRAKRLRYASEFAAPLFRDKAMRRFLKRLQAVQEALGELNDLALAARHYDRGSAAGARDWFAAGWIAARREAVIAQAGRALARLAERDPFRRR
ncbi:MAG: CYTH and CHAD domain-containing protein [Burkholderiales bacterium]|nr:CYTH and CHAD domain-containing protein [Burkholderiales bacterium]OJX04558.1 MAG: hypothetical protein BGO72_21335 [Burkholderiales bacterium 70-64]